LIDLEGDTLSCYDSDLTQLRIMSGLEEEVFAEGELSSMFYGGSAYVFLTRSGSNDRRLLITEYKIWVFITLIIASI